MLSFRQNFNFLKVFLGIRAPIYVQLALSKSCNMRCRMCNAVESRQGEEELGIGQIKSLISVLKKMRVGLIIISGGEPLLRKDIAEVVRLFCKEGISVRLQSNGLLFNKDTLEALKSAGLDGITVSLHSLSREKMAFITGVPDALDRIYKSLCFYSEIFPSRNHIRGINTVVSKLNIREVPDIIKFATCLGFSVSLIPVHLAQDAEFIVRRQDSDFFFKGEDGPVIDIVYREVVSLKKKGYNVYNSEKFLLETPEFLKSGRITWKCESPGLYFSISPSGVFLPCVDLRGRYSMLDRDFLSVWRSRVFKDEIRKQVLGCKGCMYACYPEFSYMLYSKKQFIGRFLDYHKMSTVTAKPLTLDKVYAVLKQLEIKYT